MTTFFEVVQTIQALDSNIRQLSPDEAHMIHPKLIGLHEAVITVLRRHAAPEEEILTAEQAAALLQMSAPVFRRRLKTVFAPALRSRPGQTIKVSKNDLLRLLKREGRRAS